MMQAWGVTLLRLTVGVVFVAHGVPKLFGPMWGGTSPEDTVALFALVGLQPAPLLAVTVGIVELGGHSAFYWRLHAPNERAPGDHYGCSDLESALAAWLLPELVSRTGCRTRF